MDLRAGPDDSGTYPMSDYSERGHVTGHRLYGRNRSSVSGPLRAATHGTPVPGLRPFRPEVPYFNNSAIAFINTPSTSGATRETGPVS